MMDIIGMNQQIHVNLAVKAVTYALIQHIVKIVIKILN